MTYRVAEVKTFDELMVRKAVSTHPGASMHLVFSHTIPKAGYQDIFDRLEAMGVHMPPDDPTTSARFRQLPFMQPGKANPAVPQYRIFYALTPEKKVIFEHNTASQSISLRGGKAVLVEYLKEFLMWFGPVLDLAAQTSVKQELAPSEKPKRRKAGNKDADEDKGAKKGRHGTGRGGRHRG